MPPAQPHRRPAPAYSIPRAIIHRITRRIIKDLSPRSLLVGQDAIDAIHTAVEAYAEELFTTASRLPRSDKSITVGAAHLHAAASLRARPVG